MGKTKIEYVDLSWNPIRGCSPASAGCAHCWAQRQANRQCNGAYEGIVQDSKWTGKVVTVEKLIDLPYSWRDPKKVFVCDMADLFHDKVSVETIRRILAVIRDFPKHQFLLLTKRAKRMASLDLDFPANAWVGVSVEDQRVVDRIDDLRKVNARIKWVSFEPLIGSVACNLTGIDWAVVGGESGPGWRPMETDWVLSIQKECRRTGTAFFFKQFAAHHPKKLGRKLDGEIYDEFPAFGGKPVTNKTTPKKKTLGIFDHLHDLHGEIARSNSPTLRGPDMGKLADDADLVDVNAALAEPMPDDDTDPIQLVAFVRRQFVAYDSIGKKCSLFQWRMGHALILDKAIQGHGKWLTRLDDYPFGPRSATDYMRLAKSATLDEATNTRITQLMQEKGIVSYRKEKPPTDAEDNADDNGADDGADDGDGKPDDGMADLKAVGNKVKKITDVARELQEDIEVLPPNSYSNNEKHGAFLKDFARQIRGAISDLYRAIVQMREFVKSSNDAALADALTSLDDAKEVLAILDQPILTAATETETEQPTTPADFVLRLHCADCGCEDEFSAADESGVFTGFETRQVHDWIVDDPITLCPDCLIVRHDKSIDEEVA